MRFSYKRGWIPTNYWRALRVRSQSSGLWNNFRTLVRWFRVRMP
ncbi:hypothetical protein CPT_Moabite_075 [Serratia phage Moabite]|uniref:Uncharacterized protein n=1 Tax=Serratia phage Moabite TaxID=2587814 RepID=A0A4Y5TP08_9CAUD|nr:hypothetical protein HWC48_gp075 [Serratia phage Moabite]QDB71107.1 hypothetical protein CPT_Moabite_075 [Serratia phage Moabite]